MPLRARPLLCWDARQDAAGAWTRSPGNDYWAPNNQFYPDTSKLQAGDIVLYRPEFASPSQLLIQSYQGGTFTHAAIYLQHDHTICEASAAKRKVVVSSLEETLNGNCVLFRRVRNLSADGQRRLATAAMALHGKKYDFYPVIKQVLERSVRLKRVLGEIDTAAVIDSPLICSTLCEHAIIAALADGSSITKRNGHLIMPEDLAASSLLEDIEICWKRVAMAGKQSE